MKVSIVKKAEAKDKMISEKSLVNLVPLTEFGLDDSCSTTKKVLNTTIPLVIKNFYLTINPQNDKKYISNFNKILGALESSEYIKLSSKKTPAGIFVIESFCDGILKNFDKKTKDSLERVKLRVNLPAGSTLPSPELFLEPICNSETNLHPFDTFVAHKYLSKQLSCARRGIKFELSFNELRSLLKRKFCYYSGVELTMTGIHGISVDRVDCSKGYTKDNVVACSALVNSVKNSVLETDAIFKGALTDEEKKKTLIKLAGVL